jgi:hypothetical protein
LPTAPPVPGNQALGLLEGANAADQERLGEADYIHWLPEGDPTILTPFSGEALSLYRRLVLNVVERPSR